jgi:hypothetical protein
VTVCDPNLLQIQAVLANGGQNQIQITPRVYHRSLVALVVPHKRAILLEGRDGNGLVLQHPQIIGMSGRRVWHQLVYAIPQTLRKAILILKTLDQLLPDWRS